MPPLTIDRAETRMPAMLVWIALALAPGLAAYALTTAPEQPGRERSIEERLATLDATLGGITDPSSRARLLLNRAELLTSARRLEEAGETLMRALEVATALDPDGRTAAECLYRLAALALEREDRGEEYAEMARKAVAILEERDPDSLDLARALDVLSRYETDLADARVLALRSLSIKEAAVPDGLEVADTLHHLQKIFPGPEGLPYARRALAIRQRLEPISEGTADALAGVAEHLRDQGELRDASRLLEEAMAIQERVDPEGAEMAALLGSQALIRRLQGDLRTAEALSLRALELEETSGGPVTVARRLNNLAYHAYIRGDLEGAEGFLTRGLAIIRGDRTGLEAASLTILADVAMARGDVARALVVYDEALTILRAIDPRHSGVGYVESRKARMLLDAGRAGEAHELLLPVVDRAREDFPDTPTLADKLFLLAETHRLLGRGVESARFHREALEIRENLAPASLAEAESAHALGILARDRGDAVLALELFQRAIAALEAQSGKLGGSPQTRARFRGRYRTIYRDLERLLLELGRPEEAFHVLERARGQGLLALMATRRIGGFHGELPKELAAELREVDADYDRRIRELATQGQSGGSEAREEIRESLDRVRQRREELRARVRSVAPRRASFHTPGALDLAEARASLEPGTLLLSYSLGPDGSLVYAVGPGDEGLFVRELGFGEEAIRADVERYRALIATPRGFRRRAAIMTAASTLGRSLLGPVTGRLERAERLLIVPDGVLHLLPFSALVPPRESAGEGRFLVESIPSHVVSSVTLYSSLRGSGKPRGDLPRVVGFGDPSYPRSAAPTASGDPVVRGALESGLELTPLPSSRAELEALARAFPDRTETWTGRDAREDRLKANAPGADVLHLASHGYLDERFPLESGLALAMDPDWMASRENGLLQAWEIFEELRLEADLVTLSACDTGLGREDAGEGLLGLTWAFFYAGAESVLASLWSVSDASTAELMASFYGDLSEGRSKAEALRRAQVSLLEDPAHWSPFYWAAFQLFGDGE